MFTGDGSADFLIPALYRAGFANRPESLRRNDGFALRNCFMTAVGRCAPPDNKPTPGELSTCRDWLVEECRLLPRVSAVLVLGKIAMDGFIHALRQAGHKYPPMKFAHGASYPLPCRFQRMFCSYHPSRQNTQTGRLTAPMLDAVLRNIRKSLARP
jgi:uracil-DNA glycosylase family 4